MEQSIELIVGGIIIMIIGFAFIPVFSGLASISSTTPNFVWVAYVVMGVGLLSVIAGILRILGLIGEHLNRL